jgi:hypothetical protein
MSKRPKNVLGSMFKVQRGALGAVQSSVFKVQGWDVGTLNIER